MSVFGFDEGKNKVEVVKSWGSQVALGGGTKYTLPADWTELYIVTRDTATGYSDSFYVTRDSIWGGDAGVKLVADLNPVGDTKLVIQVLDTSIQAIAKYVDGAEATLSLTSNLHRLYIR